MKRHSERLIEASTRVMSIGAEAFDLFIEELPDSDRKDVVTALDMLNQVSSSAERSRPKPISPKPKLRRAFSYEDVETPKAPGGCIESGEMLDEIKRKLTTAPTLKSRRTLSGLACELDVPIAKRDSMPRMAQKILLSLAERDSANIEKALDIVETEAKRGTTEAFMEFASFIMGDRRSD